MRSIGSFTMTCLIAVVVSLGICWTGPARAGDGGDDAGALLGMLCAFASNFNIPCPQYPTYANTTTTPATPISPPSPIVLELAGLGGSFPTRCASWIATAPCA